MVNFMTKFANNMPMSLSFLLLASILLHKFTIFQLQDLYLRRDMTLSKQGFSQAIRQNIILILFFFIKLENL